MPPKNLHVATVGIAAVVIGAAALAASPAHVPPVRQAAGLSAPREPAEQALATFAGMPSVVPVAHPALPSGHPNVSGSAGASIVAPDEPAALEWAVPPTWRRAPNSSAMRVATYRPPPAKGDADDAEVSVVRAGGTPEANIQRWIGQFEGVGKDERAVFDSNGVHITVVTLSGTYLGGGAPGASSGSHPRWALRGAIVEGRGTPYFFKMTGPTPTVLGATAAFDALLASVRPLHG